MDLKASLYIRHIGDPGVELFGLDHIFYKIFSTDETRSKYYYPIFYRSGGADLVPAIPLATIEDIKNNICLILIVHAKEGFSWNRYDTFIEELCNIYNLSFKHFVALNCNPIPSSKYKSVYYNFWEFASFSENIIKEQILGKRHVFKDMHRPYKFISLNRICHPHRWATVTALYTYKDQGLLSFANRDYPGYTPRSRSFKAFNNTYRFYSKKFNDLNLPDNFNLTLPPNYEHPDNTDLFNPVIIDLCADKFYHSYLHIVCESFISHVFFSEKTYKPIKYFQPFVLINGQYSLQYLRDMGYQTFSRYIDEGYDQESNNERRIELAIQASLDFMNRGDLHEIMKEMYPIFKHNHDTFIERCRNFQDTLHNNISNILYAQDHDDNQN